MAVAWIPSRPADEPAPEPVSGRHEAELQTVAAELVAQVTQTSLGVIEEWVLVEHFKESVFDRGLIFSIL